MEEIAPYDNSTEDYMQLEFLRFKHDCENQVSPNDGSTYCSAIFDGLLCWNYTKSGVTAHQNCPSLENFNKSAMAYKVCTTSGTWMTKVGLNQTYTDYMACVPKASYTVYIYFGGYAISIIALVMSLAILTYFKQLKCHRITLHKNLFFCLLINSTGWILYLSVLDMHSTDRVMRMFCRTISIFVNYTGAATYFWMLSEGLYLLLILVFTFTKGEIIVRLCILLGWGAPLVISTIFSSLQYVRGGYEECHMGNFSSLMYIMLVPIFVTIILNIVFMALILGILFNKLRNQPNIEDHHGKKAAKAILILTPVMGLHSLLLLVQPDDSNWLKVHKYISALTNSLQGLFVALPFCFFNSEIHNSIKSRLRRRQQCLAKARPGTTRNHKVGRPRTPKTSIALVKSTE